MTKSTLQSISVSAGFVLALVARFASKPMLVWPAFALLVFGVSVRYARGGR